MRSFPKESLLHLPLIRAPMPRWVAAVCDDPASAAPVMLHNHIHKHHLWRGPGFNGQGDTSIFGVVWITFMFCISESFGSLFPCWDISVWPHLSVAKICLSLTHLFPEIIRAIFGQKRTSVEHFWHYISSFLHTPDPCDSSRSILVTPPPPSPTRRLLPFIRNVKFKTHSV